MTGFGSAAINFQQKTISVEIKSINSKFFDLTLRLPPFYREKEMELRTELSRNVERGKVEVTFNIETQEVNKKTNINMPLIKAYHDEFKKIDSELKISTPNYLQIILMMPDVMINEKVMLSDEEWKAASKALSLAVDDFKKFRKTEGGAMEKDIRQRIKSIVKGAKDLEKFEDERIKTVKKRLQSSLEEFIMVNNIDRNRFEQELIFYIEKFDLSEEKVRLNSHCEYFIQTIEEEESSGKKLAFITQEIGREINTIGSKANDADIQKIVVFMKDELEKIKEQVLNIL